MTRLEELKGEMEVANQEYREALSQAGQLSASSPIVGIDRADESRRFVERTADGSGDCVELGKPGSKHKSGLCNTLTRSTMHCFPVEVVYPAVPLYGCVIARIHLLVNFITQWHIGKRLNTTAMHVL